MAWCRRPGGIVKQQLKQIARQQPAPACGSTALRDTRNTAVMESAVGGMRRRGAWTAGRHFAWFPIFRQAVRGIQHTGQEGFVGTPSCCAENRGGGEPFSPFPRARFELGVGARSTVSAAWWSSADSLGEAARTPCVIRMARGQDVEQPAGKFPGRMFIERTRTESGY